MQTIASHHTTQPFRDVVKSYIAQYLDLAQDDGSFTNIYNLFLEQIEEPLLQEMIRVYKRQTIIAKRLGLSRGTTRKLLRKYDLI